MAISWIVFACLSVGSLFGILLRRMLSEKYLSSDTKDVIRLVMGLIATMSALVLALMVSSATASFDTQKNEVNQAAAGFVQLDRVLAIYGPETSAARGALRTVLASVIDALWSGNTKEKQKATRAAANDLAGNLRRLAPREDFQRLVYAQALQIASGLAQTQALLWTHVGGSIPVPFLVVLVFWLAMLFMSFGLYAPSNAVVVGVLMVGALSVACAIYLILQLDRPFEGLIQVSSAPLREALTTLGKQ
jgi:hypothetical protein